MMKKLIIICEGPTERAFCNKLLRNYFLSRDISLNAPLITKSDGGIVHWDSLKKQINNDLKKNKNYVTTFIDYYGIPDRFEYPGWKAAKLILDKEERMNFLETEMAAEIDEKYRYRFIPYFQLHEFEALLFNNIEVFEQQFNSDEILDKEELIAVLNDFPNPEMINNNIQTTPSKRLEKLILGYNKTLFGEILSEAIGLKAIRKKCPRFNQWISKLESI
ncbi:MAG: DUF4276 family protein [Saprospiraceae bacterium]